MNIRLNNLPLLALVLSFAGCSSEQAAIEAPNLFGEDVVATINDQPIYLSVFNRYSTGRLQKPAADLSDPERSALIDELIGFYLMADAAKTEGVTQEQDVVIDIELQTLQMLSRQMASRHLDQNPPTETELQLTYQQNIERLSGRQYKARHILVDAENEAIDVITELQAGGDFQQLAIEQSTGPSGPSGGDLGWFTASNMVPPFAAAVTAMDAGTFSETPVQTRFGWHVILLEDINDQQAPGLEAVRADITNLVEQENLQEFVDSLRDASVISISDAN
jgi:peptidyl-prolyl cis-trans isomerase C